MHPFALLWAILALPTPTCNGLFSLTDSERHSDCINIVNALPNDHWEAPGNFAEIKSKNKDPGSADTYYLIHDHLVQKCRFRYDELSAQSARTYLILQGKMERNTISMEKSNLIVLDMDETLLDQRVVHRARVTVPRSQLNAHCSAGSNGRDLVFGIRCNQDDPMGRISPHFIVYRSFLMEFILENQKSSNFVIYSLAEPSHLISHLILIEMYFIYVFRMTQHREAPIFKFDYVIGRVEDLVPGESTRLKSLRALDLLIGDLTRFQSIQIVDDNSNYSWNDDLPIPWLLNPNVIPQVFPFEASKFEIEIKSANIGLERCDIYDQRRRDTFLPDLVLFQRILAENQQMTENWLQNGTLTWMDPNELFNVHQQMSKCCTIRIKTEQMALTFNNCSEEVDESSTSPISDFWTSCFGPILQCFNR